MKVFHVVDASGTDYCITANDLGEAFRNFKRWIATGDDPDEWEDPQSIRDMGELIDTRPERVPPAEVFTIGSKVSK